MPTVVLTGGGTAGHINPALALADELKSRGCDVYFAGTPKGVESRLVPQAGVPFKAFEASGFDRSNPLSLLTGIGKITKSTRKAKEWFSEIRPDAVVGFGGYVSIPVARAAEKVGIPVIVHEQNSVMGMANKYLSKSAVAVCLTYGIEGMQFPDGKDVRITGNPVRSSVLSAERKQARDFLGIPQDARMLLVFGGSLGARHINQAVAAMKDDLLAHKDLYVMHITGPKELDAVEEMLDLTEEQKKRYQVLGYQDNMAEALSAADAVVSRAGATSLAEISALAIPAILVPFPYATADHQTTNAKSYVESGAAFMVADADVEKDAFKEQVLRLMDDAELRRSMHEHALGFETGRAAQKLADCVMEHISA